MYMDPIVYYSYTESAYLLSFECFFLQRQCNMFDFCIISGYWLLHCPLTNHQYLGMDLVIQEGEVEQMPPLPPNFPTCKIFRFS